jgi:hypothetical protein
MACRQLLTLIKAAEAPRWQALPEQVCCGAWGQGLQSDRDFAATFARSKWRQSRWAPSRIRIVRRAAPCLIWHPQNPACNLHGAL